MKRFAALFSVLDETGSSNAKTAALAAYFSEAPPRDRIWAIALLSGQRPKRSVTTSMLRKWACEQANMSVWLFDESYALTGDLTETIALITPPPSHAIDRSLSEWMDIVLALASAEPSAQKTTVLAAWERLGHVERFLFNKLVTGGFRFGVTQKQMTRALAQVTGVAEVTLAHRLTGEWTPETITYEDLTRHDDGGTALSRPYPLHPARELETLAALGAAADWRAEYQWDGIRGQLILRGGDYFLWSRAGELITSGFPEFAALADAILSDTVLDGEILAMADDAFLPLGALHRCIGRKTVPKKLRTEVPVTFRAFDLLEDDGVDLRALPLLERRARLAERLANCPSDYPITMSTELSFETWEALSALRKDTRRVGARGMMLKRAASPYSPSSEQSDWMVWRAEPLTIVAVMIYAHAGQGQGAGQFNEFTFAVWKGNELVPFTKANIGLTEAEVQALSAWVRKNTNERFGPVRSVTPEHVFEIVFDGIHKSPRHKSGLALRAPRILRWLQGEPVQVVNTLDDLNHMLTQFG